MKEFYPKVSIIIPVYNGEKYLVSAINSALNQSYENIEVIVVDDGSTDATKKIAQSFGDKIKYYWKENGGVATALNLGIKKMTGEYFSWLSHDDEYYLNKIEREIATLNILEDKSTIIYSNYDMMNEYGKVYSTLLHDHDRLIKFPEVSLLKGCINGLTLLIPKKAFEECGYFDESLFCTQDYDKWLQLIMKYPFYHISDVLTKTRVHSEQTTNTSPKVISEGIVLWKKILKSFSKKRLEEIFGSLDNFYKEMYEFFKLSPYKEMEEYCLKELNKLYFDENKNLKYNPLISVIIPVYNGSNYIEEAINSVFNQTYKNYELIVVNDGSTDNGLTKEIVLKYGKKIKYFEKENGGVASALNYGINKAKGEYISWLSHDDFYNPHKLFKQVEVLNELENKETIIFSNFELFDQDSKVFAKTDFDKKYTKADLENKIYPVLKGATNGCTMLIPKTILVNEKGFDESTRTTNDYILWFKIFKKYPSYFIADYLIKYRIHDLQDTKKSEFYVSESEEMWSNVFENITEKEIEELNYSLGDFYSDFYIQMKDSEFLNTAQLLFDKFKKVYSKTIPAVSIIMPCYNSEKYLKLAIDSILNQRYLNFELICVDDGSNDNTFNILEEYRKKDFRIKVCKNKNKKGISGAMNTGLAWAKGEYITRMDSDDITDPERIKTQYYFLKNNLNYNICTVNINSIDKFNAVINERHYYLSDAPLEWQYLWTNPIPCAPCMFRKNILGDIKFNEDFSTAEDYNFFINLIENNKLYFIDEVLYSYRVYENSISNKNPFKAMNNSLLISSNYLKKITKIKNIPEYYPLLTDFVQYPIPVNDVELKDVYDFLYSTLQKFASYFKWNDEQKEYAIKYMLKLIENYIMKINQFKKDSCSSIELNAILNSTSWKITKPIRFVGKYLKYVKHHGVIDTAKLILKKIYRRIFK